MDVRIDRTLCIIHNHVQFLVLYAKCQIVKVNVAGTVVWIWISSSWEQGQQIESPYIRNIIFGENGIFKWPRENGAKKSGWSTSSSKDSRPPSARSFIIRSSTMAAQRPVDVPTLDPSQTPTSSGRVGRQMSTPPLAAVHSHSLFHPPIISSRGPFGLCRPRPQQPTAALFNLLPPVLVGFCLLSAGWARPENKSQAAMAIGNSWTRGVVKRSKTNPSLLFPARYQLADGRKAHQYLAGGGGHYLYRHIYFQKFLVKLVLIFGSKLHKYSRTQVP
jgi:hypothetical protein